MFRRKNRSQSSVSRNVKRYSQKAIQRASKSDQRWLSTQMDRRNRLDRFQQAWRRSFSFIPMVQNGLSVLWATMLSAFQQFFVPPTRPIRGAVSRNGVLRWGKDKDKGRKASKRRAGQKSDMSSKTYEAVEPRQMLAAVIDVFANDNAAAEPGTNSGDNGAFTIQLDGPAGPGGQTVAYTIGGTATEGVDYSDTPEGNLAINSVVVPEGADSAVIDIDVIDDLILEGQETIDVTVNTLVGNVTATTFIEDNEVAVGLEAVITATNDANTEDTDTGSFTIELVGAAGGASVSIDVDYAISGTSVDGIDHDLGSGTVTFAPGVTSQTVTFTPNDDMLVEDVETVVMTLTNIDPTDLPAAVGAISFDATPATASIIDDDSGVIDMVTVTAVSEGPVGVPTTDGSVTFGVTGDPASGPTVFSYSVGGTAQPGVDYTFGPIAEMEANNSIDGPQSGTGAQGLAGFINGSQTVVGTGDGAGAANGTIDLLGFYSSTGGAASFDLDATGFNGVLRLFDAGGTQVPGGFENGPGNDSLLNVNLPGAGLYYIGVFEGTGLNNGPDMGNTYTLDLNVPGSDGFGVMSAGATSLTMPISVVDDSLVELTETIEVELTGQISGLLTVDAGAGDDADLTDDDSATVDIVGSTTDANNDMIPDPAEEPGTNTTYTVTLSNPASTETVVPFVVDAGSSFPSSVIAQYGADYTLSGPGVQINIPGVNVPGSYPGDDITGTVTFAPGQDEVVITLNVINEDIVEDDETVSIQLLDGPLPGTPEIVGDVDITLGTSLATNTIIDDDEALVTLNAVDGFLMEPADNGYFRVTLIRPDSVPGSITPVTSSVDTTIEYDVLVSSTATPGADYVALTGSVTIPANQTFVDIPVTVIDDLDLEPTESVTIQLVDTVTRPIVGDSGVELDLTNITDTVFIHDNDTFTLKVEAVQDGEEAGPVDGQFLVSLQGDATAIATYAASVSDPIEVSYTVTGTASNGLDYAFLNGTVVIPAGSSSAVIDVDVIDDAFFDPNETVTITLDQIVSQPAVGANGVGVSLDAMKSDTLSIIDDETGFVSITGYTPARETGQDGTLTFELAGSSPNPIVVNYAINTFDTDSDPGDSNTGRDLATAGSDHGLVNGTVTFPANVTSVTIPVPVLNDMVLEGIEVIPVEITGFASGSFGYQINPNTAPLGLDFSSDSSRAEVPILADQTVQFTAATAGVEGSSNPAFVVSLESPSTADTVVSYSVVPSGFVGFDDAQLGTDFGSLGGTVTILAGNTSATITVPLIDDLVIEGTETISLQIDSVSNVDDGDITVGASDTATAFVFDDDAGFVNIEAINDGEEQGPVDGKFRVTLYEPSGAMATTSSSDTVVNYTVTGSAIPGGAVTDPADYVTLSGQVTIPAGQTFIDIDVSIFDDGLIELDTESITVTLDSLQLPPTDPQIGIGSVNGPTLTFTPSQDTFLQAGATAAINGNQVNVDIDGPGVGSGEDQGLLQFDTSSLPAGADIGSATLDVTQLGPFFGGAGDPVRLHEMLIPWNEANASWDWFFDGIDTDGLEASVTPLSDLLNNTGSVDVASSVQAWADGQANYGWALLFTGTDDYRFFSSESGSPPELTVELDVSATINIIDNDDGTVEITSVQSGTEPGGPLSNPTGEANAAVVTVSLSSPASTDTIVHYQVANGTALGGQDYVGPSTGSITIPAGDTSADILIEVLDDTVSEGTEDIVVTLTGLGTLLTPVDADITLGSNTSESVDILDNEAGVISVAATMNGNENNFGSPVDGEFTVSTSFVSDEDTTITYTITGTATGGDDYVALTGSVVLPANLSEVKIPVDVLEDMINEDVETVSIMLTSATNAVSPGSNLSIGATDTATLNIVDDDDLVIDIVATQPTAVEGASDGEFEIQLNFESDEDVRVYFTVSGSANVDPTDSIGDDYSPLPGTSGSAPAFNMGSVVIPAGSTSFTLPVDVVQDFLNEPTETVVVTLDSFQMLVPGTSSPGNNTNVSLGATTGTVEIVDELFDVSIEKTDTPASENNPGTPTNGQFTVSITNDLPVDVNVFVQMVGGSATLGTDYNFSNGSSSVFQQVTIPAGTTSGTLDVEVIEDLLSEGLETVNVQIIGVNAAGPFGFFYDPLLGIDAANDSAQETIADDDALTVSISAIDGTEPGVFSDGDDGAFVFTQSGMSAFDTTITYSVVASGTTADAGSDYNILGSGTVTISAFDVDNSESILLDVLNDFVVEGDETVTVKIDSVTTSGSNSVTGSGSATATILDDENATLSVVGTNDGEEPSNLGFFIVTQSVPADADTTFTYTVTVPGPDGATAGDDYVTLTGTATILEGDTTVEIQVDTLEDNLIEDAEEIQITLDAVTSSSSGTTSGVTIGSPAVAAIDIISEDTGVVTVAAGSDGEEGGSSGTFVVTLTTFDEFGVPNNGTSDQDTVINYVLTGFGTEPADASDLSTPLTGQVTIPAGQNMATITVPVNDDTVAEPLESLQVELLSIDASTGGDNEDFISVGTPKTAVIDIVDNDDPVLTVSSVTVDEDAGTATVTVSLNVDTQDGFTVDYSTMDDSAEDNGSGALDNDYTATNDTLTFNGNAGESYDIVIDITDGAGESTSMIDVVEATEQFKVVLSNFTPDSALTPSVDIADEGVVTITDNDTMTFNVGDVTVNESDGSLSFEVTASNPTDIDVDLDVSYTTPSGDPANSPGFNTTDAKGQDFADFGGPGEPPLPADTDYDSGTDSVTFAAGDYNVPEIVTVQIVDEPAYGFPVLIEGGLSNNPGWEQFLANLDITTSNSALADRSLNDSDTAIGQIDDEDGHVPDAGTVLLSVSDGLAAEPGDNGQFVVELIGGASSYDTVVAYTVESGLITDATPGVDYQALSGTVLIPAGQTSATIDVLVQDDSPILLEDDEFVRVTLDTITSGDPNISIDPSSVTEQVMITDDDQGLVWIEANDPDAAEPSDNGQFTVYQSEVADTDTEVQYVVELGGPDNAFPGFDYVQLSGTVTIPAGSLSATIDVLVLDDSIAENPENVTVTLTGFAPGLTNADLEIDGDGVNDQINNPDNDTATVVIDGTDSDINVRITMAMDGSEFDDPNTSDDEEPIDGFFKVQLLDDDGNLVPAPSDGVLITYSTGGTANPTADYDALSGTLFIGGGQSTGFITVDVDEDSEVEPTETVEVTLSSALPLGGSIPVNTTGIFVVDTTTETVNITDDDEPAAVASVAVNSTQWQPLFADRMDDGIENGSNDGYELTGLAETLPWINMDQLVVHFDQAVDAASVDVSDFALTGTPGLKVVGGVNVPGVIPTITAVTAVGNSVVLDLSGYLEPAFLDLAITASGMTFSGAAGVDGAVSFKALPGDIMNDNSNVGLTTDILDAVGRVGSQIVPGGGSLPASSGAAYSFRADLNGSNTISFADLVGPGKGIDLVGDQLVGPPSGSGSGARLLVTGFNAEDDSKEDSQARKTSELPTSSDDSEQPKLAGSIANSQQRGRDAAFEQKIGDEGGKESSASGDRFSTVDSVFESELEVL